MLLISQWKRTWNFDRLLPNSQ